MRHNGTFRLSCTHFITGKQQTLVYTHSSRLFDFCAVCCVSFHNNSVAVYGIASFTSHFTYISIFVYALLFLSLISFFFSFFVVGRLSDRRRFAICVRDNNMNCIETVQMHRVQFLLLDSQVIRQYVIRWANKTRGRRK